MDVPLKKPAAWDKKLMEQYHARKRVLRWSIFQRSQEQYKAVSGEHDWIFAVDAPELQNLDSDTPEAKDDDGNQKTVMGREMGPTKSDRAQLSAKSRELQAAKKALENVDENAQLDGKEAETEEDSSDKIKYCIICLGTTGTGKSSLVKFFCGEGVKISHSTVSHTKDVGIFMETCEDADPLRMWVDTQGTDDSDMEDTDEKILKKIFKHLYDNQIAYIKICWMVAGDMDRQKGEYIKQADFIAGFQTENSAANIFESALIVQKMGQLHPKKRQLKGVVHAARSSGATDVYTDDTVENYLLGFKCVDFINEEEDDTLMTLRETNTSEDRMKMLGYVTGLQMKDEVNKRLNSLPLFRVDFEDKLCIKCSVRGDPRYLYAKCHWNPKANHPKSLIQYHAGELEWYHPLDTYTHHPSNVVTIHTDELEDFHPLSGVDVEKVDETNVSWKHTGEWDAGGCCKPAKWMCCEAGEQDAKGCKKEFGKKTVFEYQCCNSGAKGCEKRFKCCNKPAEDIGCVTKYECCDAAPNTEGCETLFKCCQKPADNKGCNERFTCCQMPSGARGCDDKFECCDKAPDSAGCITICDRCSIEWGKPPGCCWPDYMFSGR